MSPWLSVLLPTYNGGTYLRHTLESVLHADSREVEIIAVDDGSADDTVSILEGFASRLTLDIRRPPRTGNWVESINLALGLARADHVCLLHQDDCWLPGRLDVVRRYVTRWHEGSWLVHPSIYLDPAGRRIGVWRCPLRAGTVAPRDFLERLIVQNFISLPAPVFPRRVALDLGGMDAALKYTADWDFWLRLAGALPACYVSEPLTAFRIHPASQTITLSQDRSDFQRQFEIVLGRHLPEILSQSRSPSRLRRMARFSADLNMALAGTLHGHGGISMALLGRAVGLGPAGLGRFVRDSRILERTVARLRVNWSAANQRKEM